MSILNVDTLSISINGEEKIKNASFSIDNGDVVLLTGPNGSGKSTIIKTIMGDLFDYGNSIRITASGLSFIDSNNSYNLKEDEKARELFRRTVCYISQDDVFESESVMDCFLMSLEYLKIDNPSKYILDFVVNYHIYESFGITDDSIDSKCRKLLKKSEINNQNISPEIIKSARYLSMNTKKMSGGQRKLTNILSNLVRCEFSKLLIFDEPLNNLDYNNVRMLSNILTKIHNDYPSVGMILVTHCRSIPIVNRILEIDVETKELKTGDKYICNSCFGKVNAEGMYI